MSRLDARLRKIEMSTGGDDEPGECIILNDAAKLTEMRTRLRTTISNTSVPPMDRTSASDKVAQLECLVWERVHAMRSHELLAAISTEVLRGAVAGCTWHWLVDYENLARDWGLVDEDGALRPCPASPAKPRFSFIEHQIVSPPPIEAHGTLQ